VSTNPDNQKVKLTQRVCDRALSPEKGQMFVRDTELKGFALRVTSKGTKTFVVEKRIEGRVRRISLGRSGEITLVQGRRLAQKTLGEVAMGIDPRAEQVHRKLCEKKLSEVYEDFKRARKYLKPRTLYDYDRYMNTVFGDWSKLPISRISKTMVLDRHSQIGEKGEAYANLTMRFLRSVLNFAIERYEDAEGNPILKQNPVMVLTRTKAWYRVKRRSTLIKVHQLKDWYKAVDQLRGHSDTATTVADYLELLLFTGMRRTEAATLLWHDVDLKARTLKIRDTKNHEDHIIPLTEHLVQFFKERSVLMRNDYVFHGLKGKGHLVEPKRQVRKVIEASGVDFTIHDIRRTFITVAESIDLSPYTIKRLVNHKMNNDVTSGYIVTDIERLRLPAEKISKYLESVIGWNNNNISYVPEGSVCRLENH
jgi:integrase